MGWLEAINGLFTIINTIFRMMREKELRQMGYKKAKGEVEARRVANEKIAKEVDDSPDSAKPWDGL